MTISEYIAHLQEIANENPDAVVVACEDGRIFHSVDCGDTYRLCLDDQNRFKKYVNAGEKFTHVQLSEYWSDGM